MKKIQRLYRKRFARVDYGRDYTRVSDLVSAKAAETNSLLSVLRGEGLRSERSEPSTWTHNVVEIMSIRAGG